MDVSTAHVYVSAPEVTIVTPHLTHPHAHAPALLKSIFKEQKDATLGSAPFKAWMAGNAGWLKPYALFCVLRDLHGVADPAQWGARYVV